MLNYTVVTIPRLARCSIQLRIARFRLPKIIDLTHLQFPHLPLQI